MATVESALQSQIRNIEARSGRSMAEWTDLIRTSGRPKHGEIVVWLKTEHGMSHGDANRVALVARDAIAGSASPATSGGAPAVAVLAGEQSLESATSLYSGRKATLKPIHDRVIDVVQGFGRDVELAPKRSYLSIRRRKQFAMLQPAAKHVDLGLILPDRPFGTRLESARTFNALFTHRVRLTSTDAVDQELVAWLRAAYEAAG
jgi:uncharacterized protein DUF5655/uncharacterized protein DUF4287